MPSLNSNLYTATQDSVEFTGAVDLEAPGVSTVSITSGGGNGDDITFGSTIDGSVASQQSLVIESGAGTVTVSGAIGATDAASVLAQLDINSSNRGSTASGNIVINNIGTAQQAGISGNANIGNVDTADIDLQGSVYNVGGNFDVASDPAAVQTFNAATSITSSQVLFPLIRLSWMDKTLISRLPQLGKTSLLAT